MAAGTTAVMVTHDHEEAFTVADDLAVMRAGRIVQAGPIAEVWQAPVDAETALFLGYARVLEGEAAARLLARGRAAGGPGRRRTTIRARRGATTVRSPAEVRHRPDDAGSGPPGLPHRPRRGRRRRAARPPARAR